MKFKRVDNLRSVQDYIAAWEKIHHPEKLTSQAIYSWIKDGRIETIRFGRSAVLIKDGLEVEKRPRGVKKKHAEGLLDEEKYCKLCDRLYDDLPKHMRKHELIATRIRKFEQKKAGV